MTRRHKLFGHLSSGRYKSLRVDGGGNGYLRTVCDCAHLNPVRQNKIQNKARIKSLRNPRRLWLDPLRITPMRRLIVEPRSGERPWPVRWK